MLTAECGHTQAGGVILPTPHLTYSRFADGHVRSKAVEWLSHLGDDDICDFLPQLVQVCREREREREGGGRREEEGGRREKRVREEGGGRREGGGGRKACVSSVIPLLCTVSETRVL